MPVRATPLTPERGARESIHHQTCEAGLRLQPGRLVAGRWNVERLLSPRGNVALARDSGGHGVVLKTGAREAIEHEQRMLAGLAHPHVVKLVDTVEDAGSVALVLEWLQGGDLVSLAGLAPRHWLPGVKQLVAALASIHRCGIAHRDLKARNVMIDASGSARLIDFGSAACFGSPWLAGGTTREAVDPRRAQVPVGAADDCYALAALLYEMIRGAPPLAAPPVRQVEPSSLPELDELVRATLAPGEISGRPTLGRFAAVIELELERQ